MNSHDSTFFDDDGPSADLPTFISTTNAHELYGLREGETVVEAIARYKSERSERVAVKQEDL